MNRSSEEKNTQNSVPWNKNRSRLSEFHSEPFRGTENFQNSFLNHSAEEKNGRNSVLWKKIESNSRNSLPEHVSDKNMLSSLFAGAGFFFHSEFRNPLFRKPRNASELALSSVEAIPSLFVEFFRNEISLPTLLAIHSYLH
jgi:hypothetical protein